MQNAAIASAVTGRQQVPQKRRVVGYDTVWSGGIVHVKVPETAKEGVFDQKAGVRVPFLQSGERVDGGFVNLFVHTDDVSLRGQTIAAEASVVRKRMANGSAYLHLDLKPCGQKPATHQLLIRSRKVCPHISSAKKFQTPDPIYATILLVPLANHAEAAKKDRPRPKRYRR